jgi:hypothetical protein
LRNCRKFCETQGNGVVTVGAADKVAGKAQSSRRTYWKAKRIVQVSSRWTGSSHTTSGEGWAEGCGHLGGRWKEAGRNERGLSDQLTLAIGGFGALMLSRKLGLQLLEKLTEPGERRVSPVLGAPD